MAVLNSSKALLRNIISTTRVMATKTSRNQMNHCLNWLSPRIEVRMEEPKPEVQATDSPPMRLQMVICEGSQ